MNLQVRHIQQLKRVDGVELSFCFIFLVKTGSNLTVHFIFDALHCRQNDARLLRTLITSLTNSPANFQVSSSIAAIVFVS